MSDLENVAPEGEEEVVPDYSRVGFRALQALCKDRGLPGDGNSIVLIERLKAYDVQHGKDVDLSAAENLPPAAPEEDDPLGLDDDDDDDDSPNNSDPIHSESPSGAGEAASAPAPDGVPYNLPEGGSVTSAAPSVVVFTAPDQPKGLARASGHGGRPDLTVKNGLVKVGEGHGAAEVRAYRHEIPIGPRDITDNDHFTYIAEAHAAAQRAGHQTRGGATVGERVGYATDANGVRTVVYQVAVKRQ